VRGGWEKNIRRNDFPGIINLKTTTMKFNFLNGTDGEQSSKRLFAFILVILWAVYFISNLYWGFTLKGSLEEYSFYLINASFFTVIAERFTKPTTNNLPKT
jgi:hypothetical protein